MFVKDWIVCSERHARYQFSQIFLPLNVIMALLARSLLSHSTRDIPPTGYYFATLSFHSSLSSSLTLRKVLYAGCLGKTQPLGMHNIVADQRSTVTM